MPRDASGIVIVDKPVQMSSAQVVSRVKRLFGARKAGHTGTLDPMATGVLVCCLNDATRLARFFLEGDKTYEAILGLGVETDTQDATGSVIREAKVLDISRSAVVAVLKQFTGTTKQQPPVYSALKHKGIPLYRHARRGNPVQKPAREVSIRKLRMTKMHLPDIEFEVSCSSGTYIRTLCADIGRALGCGGHLKGLRRTESCGFAIEGAATLPALEKDRVDGALGERIVGMVDALGNMPTYRANRVLADRIRHGIRLTKDDILPIGIGSPEGYIKVVDENQRLVAVVRRNSGEEAYRYCCVLPDR